MCVACRARRAKGELIRIVRTPEGEVRLDRDGKAPGRGAYVCRDVRCFEEAKRRGRLGRALRAPLGSVDLGSIEEAFRGAS